MTTPTFTLAVEEAPTGTHTIVSVSGDVDVTNAAAFRTAVEKVDGPQPVVIDLNGLRYLDSAGFAALDQLLAQPGSTVVLGPDSPVRAAATIMGVPCHDTVDAAVAAATQ